MRKPLTPLTRAMVKSRRYRDGGAVPPNWLEFYRRLLVAKNSIPQSRIKLRQRDDQHQSSSGKDAVIPNEYEENQGQRILRSYRHADADPLGIAQLIQKHGLVHSPSPPPEQQVHDHVPAKKVRSTDIQCSSDAAISRNQIEGGFMAEAKTSSLQKDLDTATRRIKELNRGWISTIEEGLDAAADLQKLVAENRFPKSADADVNEIHRALLEQEKARAEILRSSFRADDFRRVMQEPTCE